MRSHVFLLVAGTIMLAGAGCSNLSKLLTNEEAPPPPQETTTVSPEGDADVSAATAAGTSAPAPSGKGGASAEVPEGAGSTEGAEGGIVDLRTAPPTQTQYDEPYDSVGVELLPPSNDRALTAGDLAGFGNWELTLARNEIYARHGRVFSNPNIAGYFRDSGWYTRNPGFSEASLSNVERRNAVFIREYQERTFGKPATGPGGGGAARPPSRPTGAELLPQSDDRRLSNGDLTGMSNWQLTLARNEIYARHGRPFSNANIRAHFNNTGWYSRNSGFGESWLSQTEKQNAEFIRSYQVRAFGSPATRP